MIRVWLKWLCIFSSIFGLCAANNGVHRVSRQDYSSNVGAPAASYQQPFEARNGVYRVQRQDFTNTNDVPFSDTYQSPYVNRFSKLNYGLGNVSRSYPPLPKLFLPAGVPRAENPFLAIGLPNYNRVVPASNFGKEFQTRTSAPTRVTLRPQITIYEEKQYDDSALPAIPNYSQYDSALPSISDFSKSFDGDFSSVVEQFDMTEDKKSICKGANCRKSNENDDADAVKPIRRRRSLDYDPYYSYGRRSHLPVEFLPHHYRSPYYHSRYSGYPFYDNEYDRVYSYLNYLSKNRANRDEIPTYESSSIDPEVSTEETEIPSSTDFTPQTDENISTENDADINYSTSWTDETSLTPDFLIESSTASDQSENNNEDTGFVQTYRWSYEYAFDTSDVTTETTTDETTSIPEFTSSFDQTESNSDSNIEDIVVPDEGSYDPLLSMDFEAIVAQAIRESVQETTTRNDFGDVSTVDTTETSTVPVYGNEDDVMNYTPIACELLPEPTDSEHSETTTDSSEMTTDPSEITTDSENNFEVTSDTGISEQTEYFPTSDEQLLLEYKFRVYFVCTMLPKLYKKSKLDSYDSQDKNLYHLCDFLNTMNEHIIDTPTDAEANCADESESYTTKKSNADEELRNWLIKIFTEKGNDRGSESEAEHTNDNDAEHNTRNNGVDTVPFSSDEIPMVLTLYNNRNLN